MAIARGYHLIVYCANNEPRVDHTAPLDHYHSRKAEYTGETFAECKKAAKADGWKFFRDAHNGWDAVCKDCSLPSNAK